ncbi:hypothetical protein NC652_021580 [Populus alba x Populus x berolinensis]|nr:hypothetical protein NC652_021560 [Populus alba x Populus x berolinensis]KAJ6910977.1 hypothetical protein NC652_021580 [Populus alba x Populus x berolinensis]
MEPHQPTFPNPSIPGGDDGSWGGMSVGNFSLIWFDEESLVVMARKRGGGRRCDLITRQRTSKILT